MHPDLENCKAILENENLTCVVKQGDKVLKTTDRGIKPFMQWIESGENLRGAVAADKVVGKAAAMLFVLLGVGEIYAVVMSRSAKKILDGHGIKYSCGEEVEYIINRKKDGMCPMEKAVMDIDDPAEAPKKIKETIEKMRKGG